MGLTYGSLITAFVLIGFSFFMMQITPSGDCAKLYEDQIQIKKCDGMQTLNFIVVIMTAIIVMLIIVGSIFSKSENKPERPWSALPKGYDKQQNLREDKQ